MLGDMWKLHIYHGTQNEQFVKDATESMQQCVSFFTLGVSRITEYDYNTLLKSRAFWKQADAKYVLIFQTDVIMLHPNIRPFMNYAYVGAPWHKDNDAYKGVNENGEVIPLLDKSMRVGNGGFSIRNVRCMLLAIENATESPPKEQEDIFMIKQLYKRNIPLCEVPPASVAATFSLEVPTEFDHTATMALHQPWYYLSWKETEQMVDAAHTYS